MQDRAQISNNLRFTAAVAAFGLLLRDSRHNGNASYASVMKLAKGAIGNDATGYRREFVRLVEKTKLLRKNK